MPPPSSMSVPMLSVNSQQLLPQPQAVAPATVDRRTQLQDIHKLSHPSPHKRRALQEITQQVAIQQQHQLNVSTLGVPQKKMVTLAAPTNNNNSGSTAFHQVSPSKRLRLADLSS